MQLWDSINLFYDAENYLEYFFKRAQSNFIWNMTSVFLFELVNQNWHIFYLERMRSFHLSSKNASHVNIFLNEKSFLQDLISNVIIIYNNMNLKTGLLFTKANYYFIVCLYVDFQCFPPDNLLAHCNYMELL